MARELTAEELALAQVITSAPSAKHLVQAIEAWPTEQRTAIQKLLKKGIPSLRARLSDVRHRYSARLVLVVAALETTPAQVVSAFDESTIWELGNDGALGHATRLISAHGPDWTTELIEALLKKRALVEMVSPLVVRLCAALDLPLPAGPPTYWSGWAWRHAVPEPKTRWAEHLMAACQVPNALAFSTYDKAKHVADLAKAGSVLRAKEPTDDRALFQSLLQVVERGDRPGAQRMAMSFIEGLGLTPLAWEERTRLLAALPQADGVVVKLATDVLLRPELADEELATLASEVLMRKEKGPKRAILKELATTPAVEELRPLVAEIATGTDTTSADLAHKVLRAWGQTQPEPATSIGLWREPELPSPEPLPQFTEDALVMDQVGFTELLLTVQGGPLPTEQVLAVMVASAPALGIETMRQILAEHFLQEHCDSCRAPRIHHGLYHFAATGSVPAPHLPEGSSQAYPAAQRIAETLGSVGIIPCLLSTPTHEGLRISWAAFASRAAAYRERNLECLPVDVTVALTRMDPDEVPVDLAALDQPIRGVAASLAEVVQHWRQIPPTLPALGLAPATGRGEWYDLPRRRIQVSGDSPTTAQLLGLDAPWWEDFQPGSVVFENPDPSALMPSHTARPACVGLFEVLAGSPARSLWWWRQLAEIARPFGRPLTLLGLLLMTHAPNKDRDQIAEPLLAAWDEGRLTAEDLVAALDDEWATAGAQAAGLDDDWVNELEIAPAKVATALTLVADAGGLALTWPVWVAIAETMAAAESIPGTTGAVLEILLRYLPEVQAAGVAVDLPAVTALAGRKGSTKAIKTARALVERLAASPAG